MLIQVIIKKWMITIELVCVASSLTLGGKREANGSRPPAIYISNIQHTLSMASHHLMIATLSLCPLFIPTPFEF
jgi:hypothetical protein